MVDSYKDLITDDEELVPVKKIQRSKVITSTLFRKSR